LNILEHNIETQDDEKNIRWYKDN